MVAPDLVIAGTVHTLDPARPTAEALLARAGRIARIGSLAECRRDARPGALCIATGDGCAVPGLADAHGHVLLHARSLEEVRCGGTVDERDCAARAAVRARTTAPGGWVRGRGWDENRWPTRALPTAEALSAAVPDRPVLLERVDGHAAWVNDRALALAGIGASTPDPPGGRIVRRADGRPTGVLVDAAQDLVTRLVPQPSRDEVRRLLAVGLRDLAGLGLTAVHDAGCASSVLHEYDRLAEDDALPVRVYAMIDGTVPAGALAAELARWAEAPSIGRLEVRAVKLFADGALGSRGAALLDGYADDPGNRGMLFHRDADLLAALERIARAGFQPAVHAIGDAACRQVLTAFAALARRLGAALPRPRIEHLQLVRGEDVPLLAVSGAVASMQPIHAVADAPWVEARVGGRSPALRGAYAWRRVRAAGAPLALGSDFPVESADPRLGLHAAEARRPRGADAPWMPAERLTREEAVRGFTEGVARAALAERRRGVLREGADADLTVFGADLMRVAVDDLPGVPIVATIVGGRIEHGQAR
jgi:predicted amidohydrolase YtcJ